MQKVIDFVRHKFPELKRELTGINIPDLSKKYEIEQKPIIKQPSLWQF